MVSWTRPSTTRSVSSNLAPGILGNRPQQVYAISSKSYAQTDIDQALHTMSINPPDENWYLDTGATSHMATSQGYLTGIPIMRCDSTVDLCPLTSIMLSRFSSANNPFTFAAISQDLWHSRLGHPGSTILNSLRNNK